MARETRHSILKSTGRVGLSANIRPDHRPVVGFQGGGEDRLGQLADEGRPEAAGTPGKEGRHARVWRRGNAWGRCCDSGADAGGENDIEEMRVRYGREPGGKKRGDEAGTEGGPEVMGQGWI